MNNKSLTLCFSLALATLLAGVLSFGDRSVSTSRNEPVAKKSYAPPPESENTLGSIVTLLASATEIDPSEFSQHSPKYVCRLPGGQIYFESTTMNIDDDGSVDGSPQNWEPHPIRAGRIDRSHQDQTSYGSTLPRPNGKSDYISAFKEPYIVLPGVHSTWFRKQGLQIGDGAVIVKGRRKVVAVFADVGPDANLGEMSVRAHQLFGYEVFQSGFRARLGPDGNPLRDPETKRLLRDPAVVTVNGAQGGPFVIVVFPHTSAGRHFVSVANTLDAKINKAFDELTDSPTSALPK